MTKRKIRTQLFKDRKNEWRWRTLAANNRTVGAASEGYKNRQDCIKNAKLNGAKSIEDKSS